MSEREFHKWRESGKYLPEFMRDFHDQKDLFKAMQEVVDAANAKPNHGHRSMNATWTDYHIYTVDVFLWIMAAHGYTLQRARNRFGFQSIYDFIEDCKKRYRDGFKGFSL